MKRVFSTLAILAALGVWTFMSTQPPSDAEAAPRQLRPYTNMYAYTKYAAAAGAWLATPSSDVMGFHAWAYSDTTDGDTVNVVIYLAAGDSVTVPLITSSLWDAEISLPSVRATGFRVDVNTVSQTSNFGVVIVGWY